MTQQPANFNIDQRRANARRTAWIIAAVAVAVFVLSLVQAFWH
jgi:hypothetical protein